MVTPALIQALIDELSDRDWVELARQRLAQKSKAIKVDINQIRCANPTAWYRFKFPPAAADEGRRVLERSVKQVFRKRLRSCKKSNSLISMPV